MRRVVTVLENTIKSNPNHFMKKRPNCLQQSALTVTLFPSLKKKKKKLSQAHTF